MKMPTKNEAVVLLQEILTHPKEMLSLTPDINALLGMKWLDQLLPNMLGTPDWDYDGLCAFCEEHNLDGKDTIQIALKKLESEIYH